MSAADELQAAAVARPTEAPSLTVAAATDRVRLAWTRVPGASEYRVLRVRGTGRPTDVIVTLRGDKYTDTAVANGVRYGYRVVAANPGGIGPYSTTVGGTPLARPRELRASSGDGKVTLNWQATSGAQAYVVLRGTAAASLVQIATTTATSYTDTAVSNGTRYHYRLRATAPNSQSAPSAFANARPRGPVSFLSPPSGLSAVGMDGTVSLTWTAVPGATGYRVYRGTATGEQGPAPIATPTAPSLRDTAVTNGVAYFYTVTAAAGAIESARSSEVSATPTATPDPDLDTLSAFRLLRQSTWGPRPGEIERVRTIGASAFLDEQFAAAASTYPDTLFDQSVEYAQERFFSVALTGRDQLRQRVAWALHKIWVVSAADADVDCTPAIVPYYRLLMGQAFGNYRELMGRMTRNAAMGAYLDMLNNQSELESGNPPNENYPRELLQLFTVGTVRLTANGTPILDGAGTPIPAYTEADVKALARILTGWTFGDGNPRTTPDDLVWDGDFKQPMEPVERYHDRDAKTFMGEAFPAGVDAATELDHALDVIFQHQNVGPFIGRQLTQQLVTSNPSAGYVARVAAAFGAPGVAGRGNLATVLRAILTDPEANTASPTSGKLSEPVLFTVAMLRALDARVTDHPFLGDLTADMGQKVFYPPSVFSYFSPGFRVRGTGTPPLLGPEFQGLTTVSALARVNFAGAVVGNEFDSSMSFSWTPLRSRAADPATLVAYVDEILMGGRMAADERTEIEDAVRRIPAGNALERARTAFYLAVVAAQAQVDN